MAGVGGTEGRTAGIQFNGYVQDFKIGRTGISPVSFIAWASLRNSAGG